MSWIADLLRTPLWGRLPRGMLDRWRDRRVRDLVEHARRTIPFYRSLLEAHGIREGRVRGVADLPLLPPVAKSALRVAGRRAFARDVPPHLARTWSTSGSRGEPLVVPVRHRDLARFQAVNHHSLARNGYRPWHRGLSLGSQAFRFENPLAGLGLFRWTWVDPVRPVEEWLDVYHRLRPHAVHAYPSALREFCLAARAAGGLRWRPRLLTTGGEFRTPDVVRLAREVFGQAPLDQYGAVEAGRIAFECRAREGLHVRVDAVHVEILRHGRPAPPGEPGTVHVTALHMPCMPFIRYRLGDTAEEVPGPCSCGLWWPRIRLLTGREGETIDLPGGRRVPLTALGAVAGACAGIRRYRFVRAGEREIVLRYVLRAGGPEPGPELAAELASRLPGVRVTTEKVSHLPLTRTGKAAWGGEGTS